MIKRKIEDIAGMIQVKNSVTAHAGLDISGVSIDTRRIEKGNLFVPFKGEHADGHRFVEEAINNGAAAAFWQSDVPDPPLHLPILIVEDTLTALQQLAERYLSQLQVRVLGITGSNGKTTTKDMVANLLSLKYKVQKTQGNYNNHIGLPLTILSLEEDTEIAVLEMGMSGRGEIEFLSRLASPEVALITNIGESHLLDLGSREGIAAAKLEIMDGLQKNGTLIYYGDEPLLADKLKDYQGSAVLKTFGKSERNDVYPIEIEQCDTGSTFKLNVSDIRFTLPVLGTHNILNAIAAMSAAHYFGVPYDSMDGGFADLKLTNMRMELLEGRKGEKIINDAYNASPTSMSAAIELIANLPGYKNKVLVLGDMLELGPDEKQFHLEIGKSIDPEKIDVLFTYGVLGAAIAEGAKTVMAPSKVFAYQDKQQLSAELQNHVNKETIVLFKASRGMKLEEIIAELQ